MSSGKMGKIIHEDLEHLEGEVNISRIIIPFSKVFNSKKPIDIYSGTEKIPFGDRESEFKMILRQEFSESLR
jgi:hypothetical protein